MFVGNIDAYSHFHNNDHTKQKICPTIDSNFIYIFIPLYIGQLLTPIKTIYFSCSYISAFIYIYKHIIKMFQL